MVFPVVSDHPPPGDPTLLRLSVEMARTVSQNVSGEVRMAKREERDSACPLECPKEIASMLSVDHVVAMQLADTYDALAVILFERARAPEVRKIACTYGNGAVTCDAEQLAAVFKHENQDPPLDEKAVTTAFEGLKEALARCGDQTPGVNASVRFRVRPDGRVLDVRIEPQEVQDRPPYDCVARVVESLRVPPFSGDKPIAFHLPLPKGK